MSEELTPKQQRYVQERVKTPSASKKKCAIKAGYSKSTAVNVAVNIEKRCKSKLLKAMSKAGLSDAYLVKKLKDGLNANEVRHFAAFGKVTDKRETVDYATRRAYLDIAYRLRGDFVEKVEHTGNLPGVTLYIPDNGRQNENTEDTKPDNN